MRQKFLKNFLFFSICVIGLGYLANLQEILNKGETFFVKSGDSLELLCHIKDVQRLVNEEVISVAWSQGHDTGLIASDLEVQDESKPYHVSIEGDYYKLLIPSITSTDDKMTVVCTSYSDGAPHSITHHVFVGETPTATVVGKKDKTIIEGEEFVLECQVTGTPLPDVYWTYEDGKIPKGVKVDGNKLVFEKAKHSYSGNYRCNANNSIGSAFIQSKINVIDPSKATELPIEKNEFIKIFDKYEQISSEFGKELNLTCKYIAYPEASVLWTFNGRPLSEMVNGNGTKIYAYQEEKYTFSVLNINKFKLSNIGEYKCSIGGGKDGKSKIVNVKPIIPKINLHTRCNDLFFETPFKGDIKKFHIYWKVESSPNYTIIDINRKDLSVIKNNSKGIAGVVKLTDFDIPKNTLINYDFVIESAEYGDFKSSKEVSGYVIDVTNPGEFKNKFEYTDCFGDKLTKASSGNSNIFLLSTPFISALLFITFGNLM